MTTMEQARALGYTDREFGLAFNAMSRAAAGRFVPLSVRQRMTLAALEAVAEERARAGTKDTWIIEVCRMCSRVAVYPFCEHRPGGYVPPDAEPWTRHVEVAEVVE